MNPYDMMPNPDESDAAAEQGNRALTADAATGAERDDAYSLPPNSSHQAEPDAAEEPGTTGQSAAGQGVNYEYAGQQTGSSNDQWPPLDRVTYEPLPVFPLEAIPSPLREHAAQVAEVYQVPLEVPALGCLVVAGLASGPRHELEIKAGLKTRANLYVAGFMASGERKSSMFSALTKPLHDFAAQLGPQWELCQCASRIWKLRMKGLESKFTKCCDSPDRCVEILAEMAQWKRQKPVGFSPHLMISNATAEYVQVRLTETDERLGIFSADGKDELELIRGTCGRKSGDSIFLTAYNGEPGDQGRISRAHVHLQHPALSMFLLTQSNQLQVLGKAAHLHQSGFMARCIKLVPDSQVGSRWYNERGLDRRTADVYNDAIGTVLTRTFGDQERCRHFLTPAAHDLWVDHQNGMEARMALELREQQAEATRWADQPLRFGLIAAMLRGDLYVNEEDVGAGILLQQYLEHHAARAQQTMRTGLTAEGARIVQYLRSHDQHEFTAAAIRRAMGNMLAQTVTTQLLALTQAGYIRPMGSGPRAYYQVNPQVWQVNQ